jgi:hypothetical protein
MECCSACHCQSSQAESSTKPAKLADRVIAPGEAQPSLGSNQPWLGAREAGERSLRPQIFLIEVNSIAFQQCFEFFFERHSPMMFLLLANAFSDLPQLAIH